MKKFEHFDLLKEMVAKKYVSVQKHPTLPLFIYKYTISTPFEKMWNEATLAARGLVLDADGNQVNCPIPKFFNLEELEANGLKLPENVPYRVYRKVDGSLIQVFNYGGDLIFTSSGSFESIFAKVAREIAVEKGYYKAIDRMVPMCGQTFIFELLHPNNRIVVNNGDAKDLILLAIRNYFGDMTLRHPVLADNFNIVPEVDMNLSQLVIEKARPDFINEEGFVVVYDNGFRVKVKYEEYFRLHKTISNVNEKFVWEFLSSGKDINELGENIPDETFQFIKDMRDVLNRKYLEVEAQANVILLELRKMFNELYGNISVDKKTFAIAIDKPELKKFKGILFRMYDGKPYDDIIWKLIKPKYEKGEGGFQSFKLD